MQHLCASVDDGGCALPTALAHLPIGHGSSVVGPAEDNVAQPVWASSRAWQCRRRAPLLTSPGDQSRL